MAGRKFGSLPSYNGQNVVLDNDPRLSASGAKTATATVDFGNATGGEGSNASVTVAATWVTAGSVIACSPAAVATADHDPDDVVAEGITAYAGNLVAGASFDVFASAPNGTWGRYLINAVGS